MVFQGEGSACEKAIGNKWVIKPLVPQENEPSDPFQQLSSSR